MTDDKTVYTKYLLIGAFQSVQYPPGLIPSAQLCFEGEGTRN